MLSAWLAADPGRANALAAVAVLGWIACALLVVVARRAERGATSLLDAREEQLHDAVVRAVAAESEAYELRRRAERLQRERDEALEKLGCFETIDRAIREIDAVGVPRRMLHELEAAAVQAARYRAALERIADGHRQPQRCASEALDEERRRAWAVN